MHKMTAVFAIVGFFGIAHPGRAGLVIEAPAFTATQGESGSFDLRIYSTGGPDRVAGDSIELALADSRA